MAWLAHACSIAVLAVLAACSSKTTENNPGGQAELTDGTVGSSCSDTCSDGLQCVTGDTVPNGYCTKACSSEAQCATDGHCVKDGSATACFRNCTADGECRPGYSCQSAGSASICYPGAPATTDPNACQAVVSPANVTGGCNISLAQPAACQVVDLTGGKTYSFEWTTNTTMCETPFYLVIAGNPPSDANSLTWSLSDGSNDGLIGKNTGGVWSISASSIAKLTSDNGIFHWGVSGYYGSHPDSRAIYIKR